MSDYSIEVLVMAVLAIAAVVIFLTVSNQGITTVISQPGFQQG
jgi:hypothetical protein